MYIYIIYIYYIDIYNLIYRFTTDIIKLLLLLIRQRIGYSICITVVMNYLSCHSNILTS